MRIARIQRIIIAASLMMLAAPGCEELKDPEVGELQLGCADSDSDPTRPVVFHTDIRPLFDGKVHGTAGCAGCHYESVGSHEGILQTGLNLEKLQDLRRGSSNAPPEAIIVPGKPCSSVLVKKLKGTFSGTRMPKGGPYWDAAKTQLVIDWIAEGALGDDE
jgi:hypothetical protein